MLQIDRYLVPSQGLLGLGIDPTGVEWTVGRIGHHGVKGARPEEMGQRTDVPPDQGNPVFGLIQTQVAAGQFNEPGLELQPYQMNFRIFSGKP